MLTRIGGIGRMRNEMPQSASRCRRTKRLNKKSAVASENDDRSCPAKQVRRDGGAECWRDQNSQGIRD